MQPFHQLLHLVGFHAQPSQTHLLRQEDFQPLMELSSQAQLGLRKK